MIYREKYLSEIRGFYHSDLIKIITGVRRCGKSFILEQIMTELSKETDNFVYLDFDDRIATVLKPGRILFIISRATGKKACAMFSWTRSRKLADGPAHAGLCDVKTARSLLRVQIQNSWRKNLQKNFPEDMYLSGSDLLYFLNCRNMPGSWAGNVPCRII